MALSDLSESTGRPTTVAYRGRFAPTPSGPLHLGSLMTALASYLAARNAGGRWLLRIDDLDPLRTRPQSECRIRQQLEAHGLLWDESIRYQSRHIDEYRSALDQLEASGWVYACRCTRAELALRLFPSAEGAVYDGYCRLLGLDKNEAALRVSVPEQELLVDDLCQGLQRRKLRTEIGDFVVRRRDGVIAYQLACAIDEAAQNITHVVRGADLMASTFMQLFLMLKLGLRAPVYRHIAVLIDSERRKLSKRNHAIEVSDIEASGNLVRCLELLNHRPPAFLRRAGCEEILKWATSHWQPQNLFRTPTIEPLSL